MELSAIESCHLEGNYEVGSQVKRLALAHYQLHFNSAVVSAAFAFADCKASNQNLEEAEQHIFDKFPTSYSGS